MTVSKLDCLSKEKQETPNAHAQPTRGFRPTLNGIPFTPPQRP